MLALSLSLAIINSEVSADTRTISLYMINTKQSLKVTYKVNGRYVPAALKKINKLVGDWRNNTSTRMSPKLIDLIWELHRELGSKREIRVISGYRSAKTNAMLRRRSKGVAKNSNHIRGIAMDIQFPDISIRTLREAGLLKRKGGVGYYPRSRIPFVHIDTGNVRHWPRMRAKDLAALFKRGKPYGGYKKQPLNASTSVALKVKRQPTNTRVKKPIIVASAPKPVKRPNIPTFIPSKPIVRPQPTTSPALLAEKPTLRPSISDPDLLAQKMLLASILAADEDEDVIFLDEFSNEDIIITNKAAKSGLTFYPIRNVPQLELLEAPISIGLSKQDAQLMLSQTNNRFISGFKLTKYPNLNNQTFTKPSS